MEPSRSLYETPADELDTFVRQSLQPQRDWKEEVQDAWERSERFLRDVCFHDELIGDQTIRVLKVVKGGSSGKGTTLNHSSDVDLILFLSCFSSFQHQAWLCESIINIIEEKLDRCSRSLAYNITVAQHRGGSRASRSLSFLVQARKSSDVIKVDVLPAFDALGKFSPDCKPRPEIYENLITVGGRPGQFSPSFTELQRHFVKSRPIKLKNLLRLVKHWYLQFLKRKYKKPGLPPKYALELLTIYAWEMGTDESENFNLDEGFIAVMELLRDYEKICIYWTKYYDFQNEVVRNFIKQQLKEPRPVILDPADPTNNLGREKRWDLVAKEAAYCLRQACCSTEDSCQDWDVQGNSEAGLKGKPAATEARQITATQPRSIGWKFQQTRGFWEKIHGTVFQLLLRTLPPARNVQVVVKQTGNEPYKLSVDPYSPIWKMKPEIKRAFGLIGQQRLSFQEPGRERQLLSSKRTLADYGIFSKVTVQVLETFPHEIQVFVKNRSGHSKPYAICPDDSVRDLKQKIEVAGGPYVEDQILKFQGRRLRNHCSLSELQIEDSDTIVLIS